MTAPNEVPELERLSELARTRGLRVSVAESLTSGRLANTIGAGEGASGWFAGGIVAYFTEVKERVLSVSARNIPREYELTYRVEFGVQKGGVELLAPREASLTRDFTFDETILLAKEREQRLLEDALARDLAAIVMRQLAAL